MRRDRIFFRQRLMVWAVAANPPPDHRINPTGANVLLLRKKRKNSPAGRRRAFSSAKKEHGSHYSSSAQDGPRSSGSTLGPGQTWADLAEALYRAGETPKARLCFAKARELGPHILPVWADGITLTVEQKDGRNSALD
jgi:hypothetical protein